MAQVEDNGVPAGKSGEYSCEELRSTTLRIEFGVCKGYPKCKD